jgi:thiamine biosynthesis lipoprotein
MDLQQSNRLALLFCIFGVFLFQSCQQDKPPSSIHHFTQNVMTIDYHITVGHPLNLLQKQAIQRIINTTFQEINDIYNKWNPQSEISQLNDLPAYKIHPLSLQLYQFFKRIDHLVKLSEGLFDPTLEPLQQLWKDKLENSFIPTAADIAWIKPALGWNKIHFEEGKFYKEDSRSQIDLGGIAKGLAVDLLVERLNAAGFSNLLVEWGGEMRASGEHPDRRPWTIYISHLGDPSPSKAIATVHLHNQAIATSGDYFQFWTINQPGEPPSTYCHIFHPHTLTPLVAKKGSIASASLLAPDCVTADALAKVLMLWQSPQEAQAWMIRAKLPPSYWILTR